MPDRNSLRFLNGSPGQGFVDLFGRRISYLRISITDRCNLRCVYCMPKKRISKLGHLDILRYEEIIRIAQVTAKKGISKIRITGGEPLVRENLPFLIESLIKIPGIKDLGITTNGLLLNKYALSLWNAGLQRLNISMDSLHQENYRRITGRGELSILWKGIYRSLDIGFSPIKINVVVIKGLNDHEILDFTKLTFLFPFEVRFIEVMPIGEISLFKRRFISCKEIQERIERVFPLMPVGIDPASGPARVYKIPGSLGRVGMISAISNHFCDSCNRVRVTSDGKLRPCLSSDVELDLKTPLRKNCSDEDIEAIFKEGVMRKQREHNFAENTHQKCLRLMSTIGG